MSVQAKLNDGLLEMFRNEYVGDTPYISCTPSLCHHKLSARDQFLVLSSDGLYQYLSNEEVVLHVENFMERFPDGDPAQSLIEEILSRAAKKAGELLCDTSLLFQIFYKEFTGCKNPDVND
jgi:serine/threonine protein phosphatase PrpC